MRTDDMVREALADLAPVAPADNTALTGMHRAIGRRRRRQHVARAMAALAVLALAIGAGAVLLGAESNSPDISTQPDHGKPTTDTTGEPKPDQSGRIHFGGVSFVLPEGWEAGRPRKQTDPLSDAQGDTMCVAPTGNEGPTWDDCAGLLIHSGDFLPGQEMEAYQPHTAGAWSHSTDADQCPFVAGPPDGPAENWVQTGGEPIEEDEARPVGDRTAIYDRWTADCQITGDTFEPQAWYVPESRVLVFDIFSHDQTEAFLASFEFDS
jgi:hypothetical protein